MRQGLLFVFDIIGLIGVDAYEWKFDEEALKRWGGGVEGCAYITHRPRVQKQVEARKSDRLHVLGF